MNDPAGIIQRSPAAQTQHLLSAYTMPNYGRLDLVPARGQGAWLWDVAGKRYLDFGGGVAVTSIGHCHEVLVKAIETQARKLIHCSNWYQVAEQGVLAQFLVEKAVCEPGKCFFCNSGAEAVEVLLKLSRKFGHATPNAEGQPRNEVITFSHSFHGRTFGGISATAQQKVKDGFEPLLEGFVHCPFNDVAALQDAVSNKTVAILVEPVQGEGGVNVMSREFMTAIWKICQGKNILLFFDEVQTGLGRLGHWCGWKAVIESYGPLPAGDPLTSLVPDAVSWAKGIAGGFPFGGVWIKKRPILSKPDAPLLCDLLGPGSHGTTFGGNPLGCAVSLAVLQEVERASLCAAAHSAGKFVREQVSTWRHPLIKDFRGHGLLLGFELNTEAVERTKSWEPGGTHAIFLVKKLMAAGMLTIGAGPSVVRWLPPLNVTREEIETALSIFRSVLDAL